MKPEDYQTLLLKRLRLTLALAKAARECCGRQLDSRARHRAACNHLGLFESRVVPLERPVARICREAGATVRLSARLCDMNVGVAAQTRIKFKFWYRFSLAAKVNSRL